VSCIELVAPVELKELARKNGGRNGVVIKCAGGPRSNGKPGDGTILAEAHYAYASGCALRHAA